MQYAHINICIYTYIFTSPFPVPGITEVFPGHRQLFLDCFWFMQHPPSPLSHVPNPPSLLSVPGGKLEGESTEQGLSQDLPLRPSSLNTPQHPYGTPHPQTTNRRKLGKVGGGRRMKTFRIGEDGHRAGAACQQAWELIRTSSWALASLEALSSQPSSRGKTPPSPHKQDVVNPIPSASRCSRGSELEE